MPIFKTDNRSHNHFSFQLVQRSFMNRWFMVTLLIFVPLTCWTQSRSISQKVDSVLSLMTLEEKIGQLNQYNDDQSATGPVTLDPDKEGQVRRGEVGSMLNAVGTFRTRKWQEIAMQSRLKIPLIFGQDVVHGYKTTFPVPLAESCSWDLDAMERAARIAAIEASSAGIHWTFAPMVDISRDPRWGRVMEGAGEDPVLGAKIAAARVRGFQGNGFSSTDAVLACVKHLAAYGAAIGGRDYNSVDMSERMLREVYLPPYKAAVKAGAATVMTSFNDINGIPATMNRFLFQTVLRDEWGFTGFVVSDWGAVGEMINHGTVANEYEAARAAILAGTDMDMESRNYKNNLAALVKKGEVPVSVIDESVRRILRKKFELGLFEDPYRFSNPDREKQALNNPAHVEAARDMARKSIVLLKNEKETLPITPKVKTIAVIGPLVKAVKQNKGFWDVEVPGVDSNFIVTQWEGLLDRAGNETKLMYARGCNIEGSDRSGFAEAVEQAGKADLVLLSIGERRDLSGEAKSRSDIRIPGVQTDLFLELVKTGKPVVVLINAGRPLVFPEIQQKASAILYTWWLGSEAGNAIADVLFGDYNPSGKLTITFPRSVGQIPMYHAYLNTGRPATNDQDRFYRSAYLDESIYPAYEFGYGLSYTSFTYSDLKLNKSIMAPNDSILVSMKVTNTGKRDGEEVVQLYIRDRVASVSRPVKELKDFRKVFFRAGESKTVEFRISIDHLSFYNSSLKWVAEPGLFDIMIGSSSADIRLRGVLELN